MKESLLLNVDYSNYYGILVNVLGCENNASYMINLIQAQLLDDMIDNFTDIMKDIVADLPRMEGIEYHDEKVKLDAYIEIVRDLIDTWTEKYNNMKTYKEELK